MPAALPALLPGLLGVVGGQVTLGAFLVNTVITVAANAVASSLERKPRASLSQQDRKLTVRQPVPPWQIVYGRTMIAGVITFLHATQNGRFLHLVITLAGHEVDEIGDIYFGDELVTLDGNGQATGAYAGDVRILKRLGTENQTTYPELINEAPDKWTVDHRQRGRANIYVRLRWASFPDGIPNIRAEARGMRVFDPRDPDQQAGDAASWVWSDNAALCLAHYLSNRNFGRGAEGELDQENLIAAANICDELVAVAGGGSERRYTLDGAFDTSEKPVDVVRTMLSAMGGSATLSAGHWRILPAVWRAPSATLTDDDLRGPVRVRTRLSRRELANGVKGIYRAPQSDHQPDDFPPVVSAAYLAEDDGERIWRDIELPFTISPAMAQRLAKIELERTRQQISLSLPCKLTAFGIQPGDVVRVTRSERFGWTDKPFEVTETRLVLDSAGDGPVLGVDLELRETAAEVFDWSSGEETIVDPAPDTDLPSRFAVGPPEDLAIASGSGELAVAGDGTVISGMRATWTPPVEAFVGGYDLEWRPVGAGEFASISLPSSAVSHVLMPVIDGSAYELRLRARNLGNVPSAWVEAQHLVAGKTEPPPAVTSFTVARLADGTRRFSWSLDGMPPDVRVGGGYRIRFQTSAQFDWEDALDLHNGILVSAPYETNALAAGQYVFGIKAVDSSGNESAEARVISASLGDPRLRSALMQRLETDEGWNGILTDCFPAPEGGLEARGAVTGASWNDLPDSWEDLADDWLDLVPARSPVVYETPVIDVGADLAFTPLVSLETSDPFTLSMRSHSDAEGSDLSGTAYGPLASVKDKRFVQIRAEVSGASPRLSAMTTLLDGETRAEDFEDIDTGNASAPWFERLAAGHFRIASKGALSSISNARIVAFQNVGPGFTWELLSKDTTVGGNPRPAAEFRIYDASGAGADATVDVELKGPK